jgi:hypothetical protein
MSKKTLEQIYITIKLKHEETIQGSILRYRRSTA